AQLWRRGRNQDLVPVGKEPFGKALMARVSVAPPWPFEHRKNRRYCNCIDRLSISNKRRIVLRLKLTQRVVVCKRFRERNRDEMKTGVRWDSGKEVNWLSDDAHQCRNFAALQLLQSALLVDQNLIDLYADTLKYNCSWQTGSASRWPKINLPAAQIFERANIGLRQDVHLRNRETKNVVNPVLQVRRFALGPKVFEHIGLRDSEIDAPQIQQIV